MGVEITTSRTLQNQPVTLVGFPVKTAMEQTLHSVKYVVKQLIVGSKLIMDLVLALLVIMTIIKTLCVQPAH